MPGMGHLLTKNPTIVSAFHSSLGHQLLVVGLICVVLMLVWNALRTARYRASVATGKAGAADAGPAMGIPPEPLAVADPAHQLRDALDTGRVPGDSSRHAARSTHRRDAAGGGLLARMGTAHGQRRRDHLVEPSGRGSGLGRCRSSWGSGSCCWSRRVASGRGSQGW